MQILKSTVIVALLSGLPALAQYTAKQEGDLDSAGGRDWNQYLGSSRTF